MKETIKVYLETEDLKKLKQKAGAGRGAKIFRAEIEFGENMS